MKSKWKIQEEARFQILRLLHENPELTQRALGERVGISLGSVNYCLTALIGKGLIKVEDFSRSSNKRQYFYVLTLLGVAEKVALASFFLQRKLHEFEALRSEIEGLRGECSGALSSRRSDDLVSGGSLAIGSNLK